MVSSIYHLCRPGQEIFIRSRNTAIERVHCHTHWRCQISKQDNRLPSPFYPLSILLKIPFKKKFFKFFFLQLSLNFTYFKTHCFFVQRSLSRNEEKLIKKFYNVIAILRQTCNSLAINPTTISKNTKIRVV